MINSLYNLLFNNNLRTIFKTFWSYYSFSSYTALIQKEEEMYVAKCPEVGTISHGKSIEEAISNLKEATEL